MAEEPRDASPPTGSTSQVADGIWRIVLPTPFPVGPINAYLIDDDPLTLLDTGPRDDAARAALDAGLGELGRRAEDLGRIVISHQHIDHWGMAAELARRSGAEVCALAPFAGWLARYPSSMEDEDVFTRALLARHGIPARSQTGAYRADLVYGERPVVDRVLADGDLLGFAGRTLRVRHRPGHSPSDTVFTDEARGVMLGADHLLRRPSVAILAPPLDGSPALTRPRAHAEQIASLRVTATEDLERVLPGHGAVVDDHRAAITGHLRRFERMSDAVLESLADGPRQAIEIAREVRGTTAQRAPFFALCDVLGCLDLLVDAGVAAERLEDDEAWFART